MKRSTFDPSRPQTKQNKQSMRPTFLDLKKLGRPRLQTDKLQLSEPDKIESLLLRLEVV